MLQAGIETATTNAMATLAYYLTTASQQRALSQINMHAIDNIADWGGCQKLSIKLNQLEDEIRQIKSALKRTSKAVDATQESTEQLTRSKTIDTRSKGIPTTTLTASSATEQQFRMAQDENSPPQTKKPSKTQKIRIKNKDPVAVLVGDNGDEIVEISKKAELLGRFFASVFAKEPQLHIDHDNTCVIDAGPVLEYILFPEPLVERELRNLKEAKSSGPDDLPAKFMKELGGELFKPIAHILNLSFKSGKPPSE
ncbi:unnamed protein product [Schistocephalus solidus]|uniref:Reverse transcriptase domain-containing protein n=1 Tax=Schistocephalus solidus TaxID=70667 RepID=A0A183S8W7_SCHSO|nr:unnamed protein product [Schistocephalus solidus]